MKRSRGCAACGSLAPEVAERAPQSGFHQGFLTVNLDARRARSFRHSCFFGGGSGLHFLEHDTIDVPAQGQGRTHARHTATHAALNSARLNSDEKCCECNDGLSYFQFRAL